MKQRFTLECGKWYAMEFVGDEFLGDFTEYRYSPIRVLGVEIPQKGMRTFELSFFHVNYPQGVQDKVYTLQTISRGNQFILAKSLGGGPFRLLLIHAINIGWLNCHFNANLSRENQIFEWLERRQ